MKSLFALILAAACIVGSPPACARGGVVHGLGRGGFAPSVEQIAARDKCSIRQRSAMSGFPCVDLNINYLAGCSPMLSSGTA
jgi:hypothetical protein